MKPRTGRRLPQQRRSRATVDAILDAVVRVIRRSGVGAVTTNGIAEAAGVSIGSLYQYFPDKQAIFTALHDRHVEAMGRLIERALVESANASLEGLVRALLERLIDAHAEDPELHELLLRELPHRAGGSRGMEARLQGVLRVALAAHVRKSPRELESMAFIAAHMMEGLAHGAVLDRPKGMTVEEAKGEAVRAVVGYLQPLA
jgi:AcrR family transcriptional regulator